MCGSWIFQETNVQYFLIQVSDEVKLNLLTMSWKRTEEQKKGSFFWSVYRAFLEILVKAASLATSETGVLNETLKEVGRLITEQSNLHISSKV